MYKELKIIRPLRQIDLIKEWAIGGALRANQYLKKSSTLLSSQRMQMETTLTRHLTPKAWL